MTEDNTAEARRKFAKEATRGLTGNAAEIEGAFATVPREQFLGHGPWLKLTFGGYEETSTAASTEVYELCALAIDPSLGINNGEPQLHAKMISAVAPKSGESIIHIGAGAGYYSAILSLLIGERGNVFGYEIVEHIGELAKRNLKGYENAEVMIGSGSDKIPNADIVYVCAGATRPNRHWLDALRPGGRLVFPLTPLEGFGGVLVVSRDAEDSRDFTARFISPTMFMPCEGVRNENEATALGEVFGAKDASIVRSLKRSYPPDATAWFVWADDLWLSTQ